MERGIRDLCPGEGLGTGCAGFWADPRSPFDALGVTRALPNADAFGTALSTSYWGYIN